MIEKERGKEEVMEMDKEMREIIEKEQWELNRLIVYILTETSQGDFALLSKNWEGVIKACEELHNAFHNGGQDEKRINRAQSLCKTMGVSNESLTAIEECAKMTIGKKKGE
jgi:hypothetical protein